MQLMLFSNALRKKNSIFGRVIHHWLHLVGWLIILHPSARSTNVMWFWIPKAGVRWLGICICWVTPEPPNLFCKSCKGFTLVVEFTKGFWYTKWICPFFVCLGTTGWGHGKKVVNISKTSIDHHGERAKELPRGSAHHNTFKNYKMEFDSNVGSSRFVLAEKWIWNLFAYLPAKSSAVSILFVSNLFGHSFYVHLCLVAPGLSLW